MTLNPRRDSIVLPWLLSLLLACGAAIAASVTVGWDDSGPAQDFAAYHLRYGTAGGPMTNAVVVASYTTRTNRLTNVVAGVQYSLTVVRSNSVAGQTNGLVSDPSEVLVFTVPRSLTNLSLTQP